MSRRPSKKAADVFRREGEYWTIVYDGEVCRLRDTKGMGYLAALLEVPGQRVSAATLHLGADQPDHCATSNGRSHRRRRPATEELARLAVTKAIKSALHRIEVVHPGLGHHLRTGIRSGYACVYLPDPRAPNRWEVHSRGLSHRREEGEPADNRGGN